MTTCFVAMPISTPSGMVESYGNDSDHFTHVLQHLFVPAIEQAGYEAVLPAARGADVIHAEVVRQLETADLVLADISSLNPNVFFELGIRTSLDKPISLVRDRLTSVIPFDTSIINCHRYDESLMPWTLTDEVSHIAQHLRLSLERSSGHNPLWQLFGLTRRGSLDTDSKMTVEEKIDLVLDLVAQPQRDDQSALSWPRYDTKSEAIYNQLEPHLRRAIDTARAIANEIHALLSIAEVTENSITLDVGMFTIDPERIREIEQISERMPGITVKVIDNPPARKASLLSAQRRHTRSTTPNS